MSKIVKTEEEWKALLDDESFRVTRHAETEKPFTGKYWDLNLKGNYKCICCGENLFQSETKFDAGCGWTTVRGETASDGGPSIVAFMA